MILSDVHNYWVHINRVGTYLNKGPTVSWRRDKEADTEIKWESTKKLACLRALTKVWVDFSFRHSTDCQSMHSTRSTCQPPPKIKLYPSFYLRIIILRQKKIKEERDFEDSVQLQMSFNSWTANSWLLRRQILTRNNRIFKRTNPLQTLKRHRLCCFANKQISARPLPGLLQIFSEANNNLLKSYPSWCSMTFVTWASQKYLSDMKP